jgi:hypothetical protein
VSNCLVSQTSKDVLKGCSFSFNPALIIQQLVNHVLH